MGRLDYRTAYMTARRVQRSLTAEAFGKFLRWLSDDDEQAVQEYQAIRRKLVRYFVHKGCEDPDSLFDETVDIIVGKIDSCGEVVSPLAYCYGVAKNVCRQSQHARRTFSAVQDFASPELEDSREEELRCLEQCVEGLPQDQREVVVRYHLSYGRERIEARKTLADEHGGVNALRVKACRIRKSLLQCMGECLKRTGKAGPLQVLAR